MSTTKPVSDHELARQLGNERLQVYITNATPAGSVDRMEQQAFLSGYIEGFVEARRIAKATTLAARDGLHRGD